MSWYDVVKVAGEAVEALRNAELNSKFAAVRMEMAKLAEENAHLREQMLGLKEAAHLRGSMRFRHNVFWQSHDGTEEGAFCPKCWPADGKAVRMTDEPQAWRCPVCGLYEVKPGGRSSEPEDFDFPREPIR